jgi:hypothetical protein
LFDGRVEELFSHAVLDAFPIREDVPYVEVDFFVGSLYDTVFFL